MTESTQPTADLDAFIKAVRGKPDPAVLRLKTISWNGQNDVITLEARQAFYWPAYELDRQSDASWDAARRLLSRSDHGACALSAVMRFSISAAVLIGFHKS